MPTASSYRWGVGISSIVVDLDLPVIDRLRRELSRVPLIDGRSVEIGGLLLGSTHGEVVHIEDFRMIASEHRRGASFCLSARDRFGIRQDLVKYNNLSGLPVVGFFRSHTRPGLYLDESDHIVAREYFASPTQVFLLIRPDDPPQAGFFFWEGGEINRKQTYRSFPFDSAALASLENPSVTTVSEGLTAGKLLPNKEKSRSSRPWLLVLPFAAGALAAVLIPWWTGRQAAESPRFDKGKQSVAAKRVPLIQQRPESPAPVQAAGDVQADVVEQAAPPPITVAKHARPPVAARVALEPARESAINRTIHRVPLLSKLQRGHYKAGDDFTPARPIHDPKPVVPNGIARELTRPVPVDVRLTVAKDGRVSAIHLLSKTSDAQLRDLVFGAATRWDFEPARIKGKPVDSQVVAHFRFEPSF